VEDVMSTDDTNRPIEEPLAELERHLIEAYVAGAGHSVHDLRARTDQAAQTLLAQASQWASERLSEVEARSHYLHALRGEA
jgi:hypothetical protein